MIKIVEQIDLNEAWEALSDPGAGAVSLFVGTVRNATRGDAVFQLEYEAYDAMALKEMQKLADEAAQKFQLLRTLIVHAVGVKKVGDKVVVIGATAPHRKEAMAATTFMIDKLKETVPIWKKEFFDNKQVWVSENP